MSTPQNDDVQPESWLKYFPVPMFAIVMGIMGLALALHSASESIGIVGGAAQIVMVFGIVCFALISLTYAVKLIRFPAAVAAEWNHPVRLAFFPAISISLLLISTALLSGAPELARIVWCLGAALQAVLTLSVVSGWISHRSFEVGQLTPAWFIPAVGNVVAPIAGAQLGFIELSWLFFSMGVLFWLVLLTLVFNRLIFHDPIPAKLLPTLVILVAPPAIAFLAYIALTGQVDPFARILLNAAYVFAALVAIQAPKFARLPFALPWWALSFPVAGLSLASFKYAALVGSQAHVWIGVGVLILLVGIVTALVLRTGVGLLRNEICVPE